MKKRVLKTIDRERIKFKQRLRQLIFITVGVLSAGLGLKGFLLPNGFLDGGVMGISLLASLLTGMGLPLLIFLINIPFIILGYRQISSGFALRTLLAIVLLSLCVAFFEYPILTDDKLLIAVFGGFFLGLGIGLSIRGGGVIDGTEVLALYISRTTGMTVGDVILVFNIVIFGVAGVLINIETALYAILTYLVASKTVDFVLHGVEEYTAITIISGESDAIRKMITEEMGRGVTIFKGKRGFSVNGNTGEDLDIIYTVVSRLETTRLKAEAEKIDPGAFIILSAVDDTKGGMIKRRSLH